MGVERVEGRGKITKKIHEMGVRVRREDTMITEEGKREKLRTKLGRRAMRYEERLEKEGGTNWAKKC